MCTVSPEIWEPDCELELVTITPINAGNGPAGGETLLPGSVLQSARQLGVAGLSAKPLKLEGAGPPLRVFSVDHWAPQKVTAVPGALLPSPITKAPPVDTGAKISTVHPLTDVVLPPSSVTVAEIDSGPVDA